jgi:hypothetical protein
MPEAATPETSAATEDAGAPFVDLIDDAFVATHGSPPWWCGADQDYRTIGQLVRDVIADPANRAIVADTVTDAGVLEHAGVWDPPPIDHEAHDKAKARYYEGNDQRLADEAAGQPWSEERYAAFRAEVQPFFDEDRPDGAIPLYRVGGA